MNSLWCRPWSRTAAISSGLVLAFTPLAGCGPQKAAPPPAASADAENGGRGPASTTPTVIAAPAIPDLVAGERRLILADFSPFPEGSHEWSEEGAILRTTGKPKGYLYTKESFGDFLLKYDVRYPSASAADIETLKENSGVLVYITGEHKVWPLSMEIQGKYIDLGSVKENGGAAPATQTFNRELQRKVIKSPQEWNSVEVLSEGGALTVKLNGEEVTKAEPNFLSSGPIGLQAEGFPVEIANLRLLPKAEAGGSVQP